MAGRVWEVVGGAEKGGILVREGRGLKSAEAPERLSTGAIVREWELEGDRLRYRLVTGTGPKAGWVSTKLKDKALLVLTGEEKPAEPSLAEPPAEAPAPAQAGPEDDVGSKPPAGEAFDFDDLPDVEARPEEEAHPAVQEMQAAAAEIDFSDRPYHVVVYGATGYTGRLMCEHLDAVLSKAYARKHPWAIAGRSRDKLDPIAGGCKSKPDVLIVTSDAEIADMASQTRIVLSAAGPYSRCGEPVVRACVERQCDYVDVTGEVYWVKRMIATYDAAAKARGVILVPMCGQDSMPPDIAVRLLVEHLGPLKQVRDYSMGFGAMSGGTTLNGIVQCENVEESFSVSQDPFALGGVRPCGERPVDRDCMGAEQDQWYPKVWLVPCVSNQVDSRVVRRSSHLFEDRSSELCYGDEFCLIIRETALSRGAAESMARQSAPLPSKEMAPKAVAFMRANVDSGDAPPAGQGPPPATRARYFGHCYFVAESADGAFATCDHSAMDPYEVTAISAVTAALTLLEEREKVRARVGFGTPAWTFWGSSFVDRLKRAPFGAARGKMMKWEVKAGMPTEETLLKDINERGRAAVEVGGLFQQKKLLPFS